MKFRRSVKPVTENEPSATTGIWAEVATDKKVSLGWELGVEGRCLLEFERGILYLRQDGKDDVMIEPKKISRLGKITLQFDTGFLGPTGYGRITLTFDSASDADKVEQEARKIVAL